MKSRTKDNAQEPSVLMDNLDVAAMLGVKADTWRKWVDRGQVPAPHACISRRMFYRRADIDHFIRRGTWPSRMRFRGRPADAISEDEET